MRILVSAGDGAVDGGLSQASDQILANVLHEAVGDLDIVQAEGVLI